MASRFKFLVRALPALAVLAALAGGVLAVAYVYSAHLGNDPLGVPMRLLYTWVAPAFEAAALVALAVWSVRSLVRDGWRPERGGPPARPSALTVPAGDRVEGRQPPAP